MPTQTATRQFCDFNRAHVTHMVTCRAMWSLADGNGMITVVASLTYTPEDNHIDLDSLKELEAAAEDMIRDVASAVIPSASAIHVNGKWFKPQDGNFQYEVVVTIRHDS